MLSQNSSESSFMTALALGGLTWLMGQRNSMAVFFHSSMLKDVGSCFLVIGLNGTHPAQMGHGL